MPDMTVVLITFVAVLLIAALAAIALADRALLHLRRGVEVAPADMATVRAAIRASGLRGAFAVFVSVIVLAIATWATNTFARQTIGDGVFAVPLLGASAGFVAYAVLPLRPALLRPIATASLAPRRAWGSASRRSIVAVAALAVLLVAVVVFAALATPSGAAFPGAATAVLIVCAGLLLVSLIAALRRVAAQPALPSPLSATDRGMRRVATRLLLLLLAVSSVSTVIALVALQSGVWLWGTAVILRDQEMAAAAAGATVTGIGALAAVIALATIVGAIVLVTKTFTSSSRPRSATTAPVPA